VPPAADAASRAEAPPGLPWAGHALTTHREGRALGSPLRFVVETGPAPALLDQAWAWIRAEFDAVDAAMSRFRDDSELTRLNRADPRRGTFSRRLIVGLSAAERARRLTDGRFDPRIVVDLERLGFVAVRQTEDGSRPTGARVLRREGRAGPVELVAAVDLGGIGKGLALRWAAGRAATVLRGAGFLIEAGGDIVTRGQFGGDPWSIGIEDPSGAPEPVATCFLPDDSAIATSSTRRGRRLASDGRLVHHLIDPRTGEPGGEGLCAVTVAFPDPAWAEVWSKALFLEGSRGIAALARQRGLAAWWIAETGELSMTPAARQMTSWVRAEAGP
jgi:thiamine biosynthesis lipoprotein